MLIFRKNIFVQICELKYETLWNWQMDLHSRLESYFAKVFFLFFYTYLLASYYHLFLSLESVICAFFPTWAPLVNGILFLFWLLTGPPKNENELFSKDIYQSLRIGESTTALIFLILCCYIRLLYLQHPCHLQSWVQADNTIPISKVIFDINFL